MKSYIPHIFVGSLLLLFALGCSSSKPALVKPQEEAKVSIKEEVKKVAVVEKTDFIKENFVVNDKNNRVFTSCFKTGSSSVQKKCKKNINEFLASTPLSKKRSIIIEVHTDKGGTNKKNLAISKRRALAVASSLYYKEYKYSKIFYNGFGEEKLVYDSQTKEANVQNRRIVVSVRDKSSVVDVKKFKKYSKKKSSNRSKKTSVNKTAKSTQNKNSKRATSKTSNTYVSSTNLLKYTGRADTGWIYFGKESLKEKFNISCAQDEPRKVRRKSISKSKKSDFMTGLYSKRISGNFDNNYVEIYPVYMFENGYLPKSNPVVTVYDENKKVKRLQTTVNSYRGKKGILYRIFINGKKSMKCMDLVIPYKTKEVSYGRVYTQDEGLLKEFKFTKE